MSEQAKVLQKLVFDIQNQSESKVNATVEGHQFTFIYGVATEGLSDFEIAISELRVGEAIDVEVSEINMRTYMAHQFMFFCKQTGLADFSRSMRLRFRLCKQITPAAKEIVSAIAEVQKTGGCSGSCDCGCH